MRKFFVLSAILASLAAGCGKSAAPADQAEPPVTPSTNTAAGGGDPKARALDIFINRCTPCHGAAGAGDGPASASLDPKPRNFGDAAWQASIDDAYLEKIIKFGGAAVGKSPAMPGNPDLNDPQVVAELRSVVRGFKP